MKVHHQLRTFEKILAEYDHKLPLHRFLISYYKQNKQMGSSDRRWASRYLYSYFRLGNALSDLPLVERLAIADFLCNPTLSLVISEYLPSLVSEIEQFLEVKLNHIKEIYKDFNIEQVFPFTETLSATIDKTAFLRSFFIQPDLFIRVKEAHLLLVKNMLADHDVPVNEISPVTLSVSNGTKLDQIISDQHLYHIQDLSSQQTSAFFEPHVYEYWWDCCAASGGKSLLLHDLQPDINLLVSDVRESSLINLEERFRLAGIKKYQKKVLDLLQNNDQVLHDFSFDGILLDAPCTGSGTWGRTPEMLTSFNAQKVSYFNNLQKTIAGNVIKYLKPGKPLIYMTCSVFKAENEDVVAYLLENYPLKLEKMELIKGYNHKADSMFAARLIRQTD
ncbi:RsmB/NOP family class I SAM-dependent RNA methyltransferase [Pedobacter montanisoli]|uniref:RsmB/NOP family class I SAM-dependent RNA methyltransferase n=1 Tax=Pedobacter montanisoli TaxID=2923277 RepID=A0ABS9ZX59_9SPHI|nr:RsmB/NOP family class I SAM-dependent RNA methyltransferase [Pedobacter montanisoli]MCJ0742882.1 RsmB/NOP family class I SAM-dependent RNA methyltransferase [Pedobacter montanisoli]